MIYENFAIRLETLIKEAQQILDRIENNTGEKNVRAGIYFHNCREGLDSARKASVGIWDWIKE